MSHYLALLPPSGEVGTYWLVNRHDSDDSGLNLLLVPFPYEIPAAAFVPTTRHGRSGSYFEIKQTWLSKNRSRLKKFLRDLVDEAEVDGVKVHGMVLPELAVDAATVDSVMPKGLEIFVSGALETRKGKLPRNCAIGFHHGIEPVEWVQSKHHAWRLERRQIEEYEIVHRLNAGRNWWEYIDVSSREVYFMAFRPGVSLAVMICEDLARVDPVQPVLRSVGPNLVIALLLDGAQIERRWPGRYATSLAEDPGSSVVTLTSVGMLRRAKRTRESEKWQIGLWKEEGADAKELLLPRGSHALRLTLALSNAANASLDGRAARRTRVSLAAVHPVLHPRPPKGIGWGD